MYNNRFHKMFSVLMALLVMLSTISFAVEKHFCGETLVDVAIFSPPQRCSDDVQPSKDQLEKHSCCKDELEIIKGQDKLKKSSLEDVQLLPQVYFITSNYSFIQLFWGSVVQPVPHQDYAPPLLVSDIQVRDQVFII